MTSFTITF